MKSYTVHLAANRPPILIREGFSVAALLLGPLWLLWHRLWAALVVVICIAAFLALRVPAPLHSALFALLAATLGIFGNDLRREALGRRGYIPAHVVAARDADAAYARLLAARPDMAMAAASGLPMSPAS